MIWIILIVLFVLYMAFTIRAVKRRVRRRESSGVVEATINARGVMKRRANGLEESVSWDDIRSIEVIHRVSDRRSGSEAFLFRVRGRHVPVDEPTLLVFHADDDGAVLPAWPEVVEALLINMRHKCSIGTSELQKVKDRIALRQRGTYVLWTRK